MKSQFIVLAILKYLSFLSLILLFIIGHKNINVFLITASIFVMFLFVLFDIFINRKNNKNIKNNKLSKQIEELNLEAAVHIDSAEILYNSEEVKNKGIMEFIEKISSIKNELNIKNHELDALQEVSQIITSIVDVKIIIEYLYGVFNRFTGCDRYMICFYDNNRDALIYNYEFGSIIFNEVGNIVNKKYKDSIIKKCFESKKSIKILNVYITSRDLYGDKIAIPLNVSGELFGVLYMESGIPETFSNVSMDFLESLSIYVTIAIKNAELFNNIYEQKREIEALYEETAAVNDKLNNYIEELNITKEELKNKNEETMKYYNEMQTGYFQTVMALANSIEANDQYTRGHCQRVMEISCEIAKNIGLKEESIEDLKYSAILHDIGKIGIPAVILNKKQNLTEEEFNEIKRHPFIAYNILKDVEFIKNGLNGILQHHERDDGKGYPYGLKGSEICLFAKILCIADAFDAMTTDRPYREGMSVENALMEIEKGKGTQFDAEIASRFIEMSKQILIN